MPVEVRESSRPQPVHDQADIAAMAAAIKVAYPSYEPIFGDSLYVRTDGQTFRIDAAFERDTTNGYAALALSFSSEQTAAVHNGSESHAKSCRAPVELIFFRDKSGLYEVMGRGQLDDEAVSVDIRTMTIDEDDGPVVSFLYFAYYSTPDWFGFVGFNAGMWPENGKLVGGRMPRSYLKLSNNRKTRMEGYLAPAGGDPSRNLAHIEVAAFGEAGEVSRKIEVPLIGGRWLSGAHILERVP